MNAEIGVGRGGRVGFRAPGDGDPEAGNGIGGLRQSCSGKCILAITILLSLLSAALLAAGVALIVCGISVLAGIVLVGLSVALLLSLAPSCCYSCKKEEAPTPQDSLPEVTGHPGAPEGNMTDLHEVPYTSEE